MITIHLMGGLGNQLFQIFVIISLSLKYKIPFVFEYSDILTVGKHRPTYWNTFLLALKKFTTHNRLDYQIHRETSYNYQDIVLSNHINYIKKHGLKLIGYYQSYKYFKNEYSSIIKFIKLNEIQNQIKRKYSHYFENKNNLISLHFRLGDYKHLQDYHPILNNDYYIKSLKHIINSRFNSRLKNDKGEKSENINVLYFCEKEDNETIYERMNVIIKNINPILSQNISVDIIKVDDNIEDWEQLILMSCCHDNIIANSSFSWWGAYFNENKDKIVCYPGRWFGNKNNSNVNDLCPDDWIKID